MKRLTRKREDGFYELEETQKIYGEENGIRLVQIVGQLEDIKEELNLYGLEENQRCLTNFLRLILAEEKGFYYKKDNAIYFCRWCVRVGLQLVETQPCYAVKETTLQSCYYGDVEKIKAVEDAHYWSWKTCLNVHLRDYGKTWALTKEELESL